MNAAFQTPVFIINKLMQGPYQIADLVALQAKCPNCFPKTS
jgi:hypothetical protein